jgi:hypothetical protein
MAIGGGMIFCCWERFIIFCIVCIGMGLGLGGGM